MKKLSIAIIILIVIGIVANTALFIVDETDQVVVLQFGDPVRSITTPGLKFKIPILQRVRYFEDQILEYDSNPKVLYTADEKNLEVDNYAQWKIEDPLLFYQSVGTMKAAQSQLDDIVYSELRAELGKYTLDEIISPIRKQIMEKVTEKSDQDSKSLGIKVIDVRIKRADLPKANAQSVYSRMNAQRKEEANKYRAEGEQEAKQIRAEAEKDKTIILAEAKKKARQIRGQGDAQALQIYAETYNKDPEFYQFIKTLETYKKTLNNKTTLVLDPGSDFLKYFNNINLDEKSLD
ncbi:protease modulator HflC [Selenihalanaerobacter shriftii]|uniref:Protein HflC n=1 Tax=Selenihalanaerobacter shriftii TaxID=142842 RepID=A0A1T4PVU8_9FIRM|nr:protease modulator HflC [Selenihalanaerobacter shriftii]SJZ95417.1 membrane protease subunit HflC [Selenihalanaerobacter shriftii]